MSSAIKLVHICQQYSRFDPTPSASPAITLCVEQIILSIHFQKLLPRNGPGLKAFTPMSEQPQCYSLDQAKTASVVKKSTLTPGQALV